jgi:L-arabinose isomerase
VKKIKIAYLPLYIKLYDDSVPQERGPMEAYMRRLIAMIEERGFEVVPADGICRVREEFDRAAEKFNADPEIAAVVTQHLAYSPSLESIGALLSLRAPLIVLDTTPDYELVRAAGTENRIMPNHGIHGVQDMCSMLRRNGRSYEICAGHALHSGVIDELCGLCRAAYAAKTLRECRIGMVGGEFEGMGDFRITDGEYEKAIGAKTVRMTPADAQRYLSSVTEDEIDAELEYDSENYEVRVKNAENYRLATKAGLAVRKWMAEEKLDGVTVNFLHTDGTGIPKMPFLECCKVMERGQGYAGEGDNLTAGLVASLIGTFPDTTFCEMFCPDWDKNVILMSHMGEMNLRLSQWKPTLDDNEFNYNSCGDTVALGGCFRKGDAVLVNLAPTEDGFSLILSEVRIEDLGSRTGAYSAGVQGWMKPTLPLPEFLKEYSLAGGTHHSAMVYGKESDALAAFGRIMGFKVVKVGGKA